MKYKYRSLHRYPILLPLDNSIVTIRPNEVFESDEELSYHFLKSLNEQPAKKRGRKPVKTSQEEVTDGNNNKS